MLWCAISCSCFAQAAVGPRVHQSRRDAATQQMYTNGHRELHHGDKTCLNLVRDGSFALDIRRVIIEAQNLPVAQLATFRCAVARRESRQPLESALSLSSLQTHLPPAG